MLQGKLKLIEGENACTRGSTAKLQRNTTGQLFFKHRELTQPRIEACTEGATTMFNGVFVLLRLVLFASLHTTVELRLGAGTTREQYCTVRYDA